MPVLADELIQSFLGHLHPLLTSRSAGLVPRTLATSSVGATRSNTPSAASAPSSAGVVGGTLDDTLQLRTISLARRRSRDSIPHQTYPLSSIAVDVVLHAIRDAFSCCDGSAGDAETAKSCLQATGRMIDGCLIKSIRHTQEQLEDIVYYGDTMAKEWIAANTLW